MPAKAGIHVRMRCKAEENLDSGPGSSGQAYAGMTNYSQDFSLPVAAA